MCTTIRSYSPAELHKCSKHVSRFVHLTTSKKRLTQYGAKYGKPINQWRGVFFLSFATTDYVSIGPRFSNAVLQTLLVLLRNLPPNDHCLLVIGTSSAKHEMDMMGLCGTFQSVVEVPPIRHKQQVLKVVSEIVSCFMWCLSRRRGVWTVSVVFMMWITFWRALSLGGFLILNVSPPFSPSYVCACMCEHLCLLSCCVSVCLCVNDLTCVCAHVHTHVCM